jgi:hypothetical protein
MSEKKTTLEVNALSQTELVRDLTTAELQLIADTKVEADGYEAIQEAKKEARLSALAKLAALGLTEEEIAAL